MPMCASVQRFTSVARCTSRRHLDLVRVVVLQDVLERSAPAGVCGDDPAAAARRRRAPTTRANSASAKSRSSRSPCGVPRAGSCIVVVLAAEVAAARRGRERRPRATRRPCRAGCRIREVETALNGSAVGASASCRRVSRQAVAGRRGALWARVAVQVDHERRPRSARSPSRSSAGRVRRSADVAAPGAARAGPRGARRDGRGLVQGRDPAAARAPEPVVVPVRTRRSETAASRSRSPHLRAGAPASYATKPVMVGVGRRCSRAPPFAGRRGPRRARAPGSGRPSERATRRRRTPCACAHSRSASAAPGSGRGLASYADHLGERPQAAAVFVVLTASRSAAGRMRFGRSSGWSDQQRPHVVDVEGAGRPSEATQRKAHRGEHRLRQVGGDLRVARSSDLRSYGRTSEPTSSESTQTVRARSSSRPSEKLVAAAGRRSVPHLRGAHPRSPCRSRRPVPAAATGAVRDGSADEPAVSPKEACRWKVRGPC